MNSIKIWHKAIKYIEYSNMMHIKLSVTSSESQEWSLVNIKLSCCRPTRRPETENRNFETIFVCKCTRNNCIPRCVGRCADDGNIISALPKKVQYILQSIL